MSATMPLACLFDDRLFPHVAQGGILLSSAPLPIDSVNPYLSPGPASDLSKDFDPTMKQLSP